MTNVWRFAMAGALALACTYASRGEASVIIEGTRVIYSPHDKDATVKLTNTGKKTVLVQAWMDSGDNSSTPNTAKAPFTLTPPMFRLDPGKGQAIRVLYDGTPLPSDKETLFWFDVLEIPPKAKDANGRGVLQFSIRTRIKFFFRPPGLSGSAAAAFDQLSWKLVPGAGGKGVSLRASNPTPYYVNFANVGVDVGGQRHMANKGGFVAPGASADFPVPGISSVPSSNAKAEFDTINDYGAIGSHEKLIGP
jgi:chaperone protein EcpD